MFKSARASTSTKFFGSLRNFCTLGLKANLLQELYPHQVVRGGPTTRYNVNVLYSINGS